MDVLRQRSGRRCLKIHVYMVIILLVYVLSCYQCIRISQTDIIVEKESGTGDVAISHTNVTLVCIGDNPNQEYYIENKVVWSMVDHSGKETLLTSGFYLDKSRSSRFNDDKYGINVAGIGPLVFALTIYGVTYSDDGVYTCTQYDAANNVVYVTNATVTVLRQVERIEAQVLDLNNNTHVSRSDISASTEIIKFAPGTYKVKCNAIGSNPGAHVTLKHSRNGYTVVQQLNVNSTKRIDDSIGGVKYTSVGIQTFDLMAMPNDQSLTCVANIPFGNYSSKAISMIIRVEKPKYDCETVTDPAVGYQVVCSIEADYRLFCDGVRWIQWTSVYTLSEPKTDHPGDNVRLHATCKTEESGYRLQTSIFVNDIGQEISYFIRYGNGPYASDYAYGGKYQPVTASSNPLVSCRANVLLVLVIVQLVLLSLA